MVNIVVERTVNAPIAEVWASWDDYANIADFHPGLNASYLLDQGQATGVGATRQCDFTDGKTFLKERVTGYETNKRMVIDIFDTNAPIKDAKAVFEFAKLSERSTRVTMTMMFTPKMGVIGRMLTPVMKMQFRKGLSGLLESNARHVEQAGSLAAAA
ncbi:MAG: SRPBCC family protein [Pseudomonadota bacterium]